MRGARGGSTELARFFNLKSSAARFRKSLSALSRDPFESGTGRSLSRRHMSFGENRSRG